MYKLIMEMMEKISVTLRDNNSHDSDLMIIRCLTSGRQWNANVSSFFSSSLNCLTCRFITRKNDPKLLQRSIDGSDR